MSAKGSRNKKRTRPGRAPQSSKGPRPAVDGRPVSGSGPAAAGQAAGGHEPEGQGTPPTTADRPGTGPAPPLNVFRAPSVSPPAGALPLRTFPSSRVSAASGRPVPGAGASPAAAGLSATVPQPSATAPSAAPPRTEADVPTGVGSGAARASAGSSPTVSRPPGATPPGAMAVSTRTVPTALAAGTARREQPVATPRPPFLATDMPDGPVQVMSWNCAQLDGVEPHGLGLTYWFDAAPTGDPYPVSVRFTGRLVSNEGETGSDNAFETVRTLHHVVPGSGRIALTTRVAGIAAGRWEVSARPVVLRGPDGAPPPVLPPGPLPSGSSTGTTAFLPLVKVRAPGVRIGAWPALVGLGFLGALLLQWLLGVQRDLPMGRILLVSVLASLVGLVGAKVYYLLTHREQKVRTLTAGMSVQGFVLAAITALVLGGWWAGVPIGPMLDVSAPGLLLGMTIGRLGCFFGGCCVGRPTASRWGIWSSDRGVGVRRIPVQLFESAMAGTVATATLLAVVLVDPALDGLLFLAGLSAYTFGRQVLFPLRGIPRTTSHGRVMTMVVTGLVLVASVLTAVLA